MDTSDGSPRMWHVIREWALVIVIALILSFTIRFFIAEPFIVNGASMDPTFSTNQFLVVDRLSYRFTAPGRDDVIVFQFPEKTDPKKPDVYYIKRIIGLPGETLRVQNGAVTVINTEHPEGFKLVEPYVEPAHASHENFTTTLGPTEYFVMGDNRAESSDSRVWGALDRHFIIGRPAIRLFPLSAISLLPGSVTPTTTSTNITP